MNPSERDIIRRFADGDESLREQAIAIHRAYIPTLGVRGTLEQDFMAEIDHPAPDPMLRGLYRNRLLGKPGFTRAKA